MNPANADCACGSKSRAGSNQAEGVLAEDPANPALLPVAGEHPVDQDRELQAGRHVAGGHDHPVPVAAEGGDILAADGDGVLQVADDGNGFDLPGRAAQEPAVVHDPDHAAPVGDGPDLGVVEVPPRGMDAGDAGVGHHRGEVVEQASRAPRASKKVRREAWARSTRIRRSLSASTSARPSAVRPPRPRLLPRGEEVAPRRESVRCMSVTRRRVSSGTRRTSAGESKAFPPWMARCTVNPFESEVELELEAMRCSRLMLARRVRVRVPDRRAGLVAIERTTVDRPAARRRGRSAWPK